MVALDDHLPRLTEPILDSLSRIPYTPPEGATVSVKPILESLLSNKSSVKDFALACALLSSSSSSAHELLSWIPENLSIAADAAFRELSGAYGDESGWAVELMPQVLPLLKGTIEESSIDYGDETGEVFAASARVPVGFAIVAAYQFRWFVTQVEDDSN